MNAAARAFVLCLGVAALVALRGGFAQEPKETKPYTVECGPDAEEGGATTCRVDRATYVGWRTFHAICHTCHGQDALGSSFAPDLTVRVREIDKTTFLKAMNEG